MDRARQAGLTHILVPGIDHATNLLSLELADRFPEIYAAVGIHPNDGLTWNSDTFSSLKEFASHPKVVAIGEIGLDYYRDRCPREIQKRILQEQLTLAAEMNLPVILHNREALQDLAPLLVAWQKELVSNRSLLANHPGVLHSFDGTLQDAGEVLASNFFIGLNGPVTFKNAPIRQDLAITVPDQALLLETDAPFLTPHPHRGERNEPAFIKYINKKIASLRGVSEEHIAKFTSDNANRLFHWRDGSA